MEWIKDIIFIFLRVTGLDSRVRAWELKRIYKRAACKTAGDQTTRKTLCDIVKDRHFFNHYALPLVTKPEDEWSAMIAYIKQRLSIPEPKACEIARNFYETFVNELEDQEHWAERRQKWLSFFDNLPKKFPQVVEEFALKPCYSDPTYIRYFFYFADEVEKLAADHNRLAADLGCSELTEGEKIVSEMDKKREPYRLLHCQHSISCLLHVVKDTLIWQVAYSAGKEVSDPKVGWGPGVRLAWESVKGAYGTSELFAVNVQADDLKRATDELYVVIHELRPELPQSPKGGEAIGETGYFRWIGGDTFLLLVREASEEAKSAVFQCGTFPRLMMQIHKARHYKRLVAESVEMVRNTINVFTSGSRGIVTDAGSLRRRHLLRLVEISLIDIDIMVENIEKAHTSYCDLIQEWTQGLSGEVWNQFERRIKACLDNARYDKEKLEKEKKLVEPVEELPFGLDERIKALSEQLDSRLRKETLDTYRTLRNANNPVDALLQLCRASLCLMNLLFATVNENAPSSKSRPSDNLWDCIVRAGKGDEKTKIQGLRILPDEMASLLHVIRTYANKADHNAEKVRLTVEDAEIGLTLFLRVVEWFYCEYAKGPQLPSIYNHVNRKALI
jgi:hypothetical protein